MTDTEQGNSTALDRARSARGQWIGLTYGLTKDVALRLGRLWNEADGAVLRFIRALEQEEGSRS